MLAFLVGGGLNVPGDKIQRMLELYGLELYQDRYRPAHLESLRRAKRERVRKRMEDVQLLDKVAKMDVPDSQLPPLPKKKHRRR